VSGSGEGQREESGEDQREEKLQGMLAMLRVRAKVEGESVGMGSSESCWGWLTWNFISKYLFQT